MACLVPGSAAKQQGINNAVLYGKPYWDTAKISVPDGAAISYIIAERYTGVVCPITFMGNCVLLLGFGFFYQ
jgi:hypothetical protein